ncbi:MAG: GNA1162 family protein [Elusimicrobiota bacterium]
MTSAGLSKFFSEKYRFLIFILIFILFISNCALKPKFIISNYSRPAYVAILPFDNLTNDLMGPDLLRNLFITGLRDKGYNVQELSQTDELLKGAGITDAGHLPTITSGELSEKLGVEAAFYGRVVKFNFVTLGFYSNRVVEANFKLVDLKHNDVLWEDERKDATSDIALSAEEARENLKGQLIEKTVERLFKSPLLRESRNVVTFSLSTLP